MEFVRIEDMLSATEIQMQGKRGGRRPRTTVVVTSAAGKPVGQGVKNIRNVLGLQRDYLYLEQCAKIAHVGEQSVRP